MPLAVQRLRLPDTGRVSYTLLGDDALPVAPAEAYLAYLQVSASPNTLGELIGTRPTGSYVPMLAHVRRAARDSFSPLRITARRKVPKTLTPEEAALAMAACSRARDRFLVSLPDEAGLRIGEALGLRHEDLSMRCSAACGSARGSATCTPMPTGTPTRPGCKGAELHQMQHSVICVRTAP